MNKLSFPTFHEASSFARSKSQELGRTVTTNRDGNNFVVIFDQPLNVNHHPPPHNYSPSDSWERHLQEERDKEKREQKKREFEQKSIQGLHKAEAERETYLDGRKKYFESLSDKDLDYLWATREDSNMEEDEMFLLRSTVREKKGIKTVSLRYTR